VVHPEDGDAGVVQLLQLRVDRGVTEDRDDRVDVLREEDVVVLRVQGVVAVAVGGQRRAAELGDLVDRALEGLAVPEVLRSDDRDADGLARERLAGVDALAVGGRAVGRDGRTAAEGDARRDDGRGRTFSRWGSCGPEGARVGVRVAADAVWGAAGERTLEA